MKDPTDELHVDALFTLLGRLALEAKGIAPSREGEKTALVAGEPSEHIDLEPNRSVRQPSTVVKRHHHADQIDPLLR